MAHRLDQLLAELGEPAFRARQIDDWKYRRLAGSYHDMVNLPVALRDTLQERLPLSTVQEIERSQSADGGTTKFLFQLADGQLIETVLMRQHSNRPGGARNTVCISSQAGCKMACSFCATGHGGWQRNLDAQEMVDQLLAAGRVLKGEEARVHNVVFMGMGEPLDNYEQLLAAIGLMNAPAGCALGARSVTVSTCGLVPRIERLASEPLQVNLAVSLAATTDELRSVLIPANRRWPLAQLLEACDDYARRTRRRVSFEYVLIAGVNDTALEARRLASLLRGRLAHVNLIPLNPVAGDAYQRPAQAAVRHFEDIVKLAGLQVSVRYSKGVDIVAGCGQLRAARTTAVPDRGTIISV